MQSLARALLTNVMILGAMLLFTTATVHASPPLVQDPLTGKPLADLLNPDGTLNLSTGYRGSLDVAGWQLASGPGQAPRFMPLSLPGDSNWSAMASAPYFVYAVAVYGSMVYVAGNWTLGGVLAWDGGTWVGLEGPQAKVYALAVDASGNLYAGGNFTAAFNGGVGYFTANRIVKRDAGSSLWVAMGHGVADDVYAIAISGSDVYVGGRFTQTCGNDSCSSGTTANEIARWDGSWHSVGNGVNSLVNALAVDGSNVYAGGSFTVAHNSGGDVTVNRIAKWDGSNWSALANGLGTVSDGVFALGVDSSHQVYAAGSFTAAHNSGGDVTVNNVAKWSGSSWSALGGGLSSTGLALAIDSDDNVFVGGVFSSPAAQIAKWNGSSWEALGSGVNDMVEGIAIHGNKVYVGGTFTHAGGNPANYIAQWTIPSVTYADTAGTCGSNWPCYTSIQAAIKAVSSAGSVVVYTGTYPESVLLNKNVSVIPLADLTLNGNLDIFAGTFNAPTGNLSITGNVVVSGGFLPHHNGTIRFTGTGTQTLGGSAFTFYNVYVGSGSTVFTYAQVTLLAGLTNNGLTRETTAVAGTGSIHYGLANVTVNVTTRGGLTNLEVDRRDQNHPHAPLQIQTGKYWTITPTGTGYTVNLTLPHSVPDPAQAHVCRYLDTGELWDCAPSSATATTVTRNGITQLSDWAVAETWNDLFVPFASK